MRYILSVLGIFSGISYGFGSEKISPHQNFMNIFVSQDLIKLPSENILKNNILSSLKEPGVHFLEKTTLPKQLAEKKLSVIQVKLQVELAIYDYIESMDNQILKITSSMFFDSKRKEDLVTAIINSK